MHWKNENNSDIKQILQEYQLSYRDILPYISNFSHTSRISEELCKPLEPGRKDIYLYAIEQAKLKKIRKLTNNKGV